MLHCNSRWSIEGKTPTTTASWQEPGFSADTGGEDGIRTHDYGFRPYTRLAGGRLRPLGHLSPWSSQYRAPAVGAREYRRWCRAGAWAERRRRWRGRIAGQPAFRHPPRRQPAKTVHPVVANSRDACRAVSRFDKRFCPATAARTAGGDAIETVADAVLRNRTVGFRRALFPKFRHYSRSIGATHEAPAVHVIILPRRRQNGHERLVLGCFRIATECRFDKDASRETRGPRVTCWLIGSPWGGGKIRADSRGMGQTSGRSITPEIERNPGATARKTCPLEHGLEVRI